MVCSFTGFYSKFDDIKWLLFSSSSCSVGMFEKSFENEHFQWLNLLSENSTRIKWQNWKDKIQQTKKKGSSTRKNSTEKKEKCLNL